MPMLPAFALLLLYLAPGIATAQDTDALPPLSAAEIEEARAGCEQLARMPSAPISVEACKAMLGMGTRLQSDAADPSGRRPGDESMTCAAIFAELQTLADVGISEASTAKAEAAAAGGTAVVTHQTAQLGAFIVETYTRAASSGRSAPSRRTSSAPRSPPHGRRGRWTRREDGGEQASLRAPLSEAMVANIGELGQSMQANPRFARLTELGAGKEREAPGKGTGVSREEPENADRAVAARRADWRSGAAKPTARAIDRPLQAFHPRSTPGFPGRYGGSERLGRRIGSACGVAL